MDDRAIIRDLEGFHDRWLLAVVAVGVLAFAALLTVVVDGLRDNDVRRSADAVTLVQPSSPQVFAPPAGPVR